MARLETLKQATTKKELAVLLGVKTSILTYSLYILKISDQYEQFEIPKRKGGMRVINAPQGRLKIIQSNLSNLLLDCIDEINKAKSKESTLSHGFVRRRSIFTNALMHINKKNVLNIDLHDFFGSFNFGRVRGFFIKNEHFKLDPHIATVIAQIACYNNVLPQGSPCSPVITNLITHSLDIRLASIAKKHSCTYSRYADDITFSTRESEFPKNIMSEKNGKYTAGKALSSAIKKAGFSINDSKTRIQCIDSRQDVTGLVVNKKPNIKKEYWRTVKSQCNSLFHTGTFTKKVADIEVGGNINELEGQLNFIDQIDLYNRLRQKLKPNPAYSLSNHGYKTSILLSGREKTFSKFLYYCLFYGNTEPTMLCEGKTDNVYLRSAINKLASDHPDLAIQKTSDSPYKLLVKFVKYSKRTRFLLELHGGTSYLKFFITKFDKHFQFYKAPKPQHPVIIILDNDDGFPVIKNTLNNISSVIVYPTTLKKDDYSKADFIHVMHNLYIVLTPLKNGNDSAIEDLFDDDTKKIKVAGKSFNPEDNADNATEYGKEVFAKKVVAAQKDSIDFEGFKPLLSRIVSVINHFNDQ